MDQKNRRLVMVLLAMLGSATWADVTTTIISVADTGVRDVTNTYGSDNYMYVYGLGGTSPSFAMAYVRFNLSAIPIDTILDATFKITVSGNAPRNDTVTVGRFALHGLYNMEGNTSQNWDEATLNQSGTGSEVNWTAGTLDMTRVLDMDSNANSGVVGANGITEILTAASAGAWARGTTITVVGTPLVDFLNSRLADGGLVTFIINPEVTNNRGYGIVSREETADLTYRPELILTYIPGGASNPQPEDGAIVGNNILTQLSWTNAEDIGECDVYFGTEPNLPTMDKLSFTPAVSSVIIDNFASYSFPLPEGTYYWRVDSYKGDPLPEEPNMPGLFWTFNVTSAPVVTQQTAPPIQGKFAGETAEFTVVFSSNTPITYTWYRSDDNTNDTPDDDTVVGGNSDTLTLSGLTLDDAGYYYCKAANPGETRSAPARLSIKQLYAHWKLDGNAEDSSGNALHGTLYGEPVFDTGVNELSGQAMVFDGTNDYIQEPNNFSDFAAGLTVSVWAKPAAAGSYERFIDFGNGAPGDNIFFARAGTANNLILGVHIGEGASMTVTATDVLLQDEWQFFAATLDEAGNVTLYKDGLPIQTGTINAQPTVITRTLNYIGESNWEDDALYTGMMDDIYIYNYPRSADEIATAYAEFAGNFCRTQPAYDWDDNCKVDIGDLIIFAATWLDCGLYPACP